MNAHSWNDMKASASGAALACDKTPFVHGRNAVLSVSASEDANFDLKIEQSDDGTTWSDLVTVAQVDALVGGAVSDRGAGQMQITLPAHIRPTMSGYSAGYANVSILSGA